MISKKVDNVSIALQGIKDNMTLMLGGFGLCGIPENSITHLVKLYVKGNELVVEYLLKNLPGIEIDNSGSIKIEGKEIEIILKTSIL